MRSTTTTTNWRSFRRFGRGLAAVGLILAMIGLMPRAAGADPNWDPADNAFLHEAHKGSTNPGFKSGDCPAPPEGAAGDWGWHFVLPGSTSDFVTVDVDFASYGFHQHVPFVADPDGKHAYVYTPGPDTLNDARAVVTGTETEFVLSHVCEGTTSTTTTTVPETTTTVPETTTTVPETTTTVPETTTTIGDVGGETATTAPPSVLGETESRAVAGEALPRTGSGSTMILVVMGLGLIVLGGLASRKATLLIDRT